ncbi:MAG: hypothetical protein AAFQ64_12385 [Pseudomonadota bacterium]
MNMPTISFTIGATGFVFIGLLHTYVHVTELMDADLRELFTVVDSITVNGVETSLWDLFQGVSLLMGFFSVALGGVLLASLGSLSKRDAPSRAICLVTLAMLFSIMTMGWVYLSNMQIIGGAFGLICFGIPLFSQRKLD